MTTSSGGFEAACEEVPGLLGSTAFQLSSADRAKLERLGSLAELRIDVTGVGGSESPARFVVAALLARGFSAQYLPMTSFLDVARPRRERLLIVVSQRLSPNAQLALESSVHYGATILVTGDTQRSASARAVLGRLESEGAIVVSTPVPSEPESLVRLAGPVCLAGAGLALVRQLESTKTGNSTKSGNGHGTVELDRVCQSALERARALAVAHVGVGELLAIVLTEPLGDLVQADLLKWREALHEDPPPVFDGFAFVHGPLQTLTESPGLVLIVGGDRPTERALRERLRSCIRRSRHVPLEFSLAHPGELGWFDINALLSQWILRTAEERRLDLCEWRGKSWDEPVYPLSSVHTLEAER